METTQKCEKNTESNKSDKTNTSPQSNNEIDSIHYYTKCYKKIKSYNLISNRFKFDCMSKSAESDINRSKLKQRSDIELEEWQTNKYYLDDWCEKMLQNSPDCPLQVSYENYDELTHEDFILKYESLSKPLIIKGTTKNWRAADNWTFEVKIIYRNVFLRKFTIDLRMPKLKLERMMMAIS